MASGSLPDPPASDVEAHVLDCPVCQATTARFGLRDTFVEEVRKAGSVGGKIAAQFGSEDQSRVDRLVAELSGLRSSSNSDTAKVSQDRQPTCTGDKAQDELLAELASSWRPPQQADELGRLGGYRVLRLLGAGGMGGVFLAEDPQLNRQVALKLMRPQAAAMPGAAERFLREARAAAAVRDDHVVTIYQVGQDHGVPFIAQELLAGETLEERLKREGRLDITEALAIGRQIAAGLAAAHARSLMHRDIKPANVWLECSHLAPRDESGSGAVVPHPTDVMKKDAARLSCHPLAEPVGHSRVKLLDFGLARSWTEDSTLTQSGLIMGTPAYMSPEQASGQAVDARADLFSLGVVLYRMLTGRSPFQRQNLTATLLAVTNATPAAPQSLSPDIPSALSDLVMRLLAKEPAERPATAEAVADELARIERQDPAAEALPQIVLSEPARIRSRPAPMWQLALAGSVLGACVLAGVIIIKITAPDGSTTEIRVPDDRKVEVAHSRTDSKTASTTITVPPGSKVEVTGSEKQADRRAARWVLAIGGSVAIAPQDRLVQAAEALPADVFRLHTVDLNGNQQVSDAGLANLADLEHLTSLDLRKTRISDAGLAHLKGMTTLQGIHLGGTLVGDNGMKHLRGNAKLRKLFLYHTKVTDAGLEQLKDLTSITDLDLGGLQLTDAGISHLKGFKELTWLSLTGQGVTDAGLANLKGLTNLTVLGIGYTSVTDFGLEHLKNLTNLRHLNLDMTRVSDTGLVHLQGLRRLENLGLLSTKVTPAGVAMLKKSLPQCEIAIGDAATVPTAPVEPTDGRQAAAWALACGGKVTLRLATGGHIVVAAAKDLPEGPLTVVRVILTDCGDKVTDDGLENLVGLNQITHIYLQHTPVTDAGLEHVGKLTSLVDAQLGNTRITDEGLAKLKGLPQLGQLSLFKTRVTDRGLKHLKDMRALYSLDLNGTQITDVGLEYLGEIKSLSILDLSARGAGVTDAGLMKLRGLTEMTRLDLNGPGITDAALAHLKGMTKLTTLDLRQAPITDDGLEHLYGFSQLRELYLPAATVTRAGAEKLQKILPNCKVVLH